MGDEMISLTKSLEVTLGPDTSDLAMRLGLHSGQVTVGVLRGQKSRFQLFGDTVNTAARMESNGIRNRIHISEETAMLLKEAGKEHWLIPREETIQAKGKGELSTYWVFEKRNRRSSCSCASTVVSTDSEGSYESNDPVLTPVIAMKSLSYDRRRRLIDWNVDLFAGSIRKIIARRGPNKNSSKGKRKSDCTTSSSGSNGSGTVLDEVVEIIELPSYDPKVSYLQEDHQSIRLDDKVMMQLRKYISTITSKYNENPFHNFEHASHVTMSVAKLLSRIVAPNMETSTNTEIVNTSSTLHDHTYGITSDPLTQFACVFSALIHDVDHQGVPNSTLVQEDDEIARKYNGRSVAEQNSVDIAWELFLEPEFSALQDAVCATDVELDRLRKLIVNMVMATDIMDKDLKQLRNKRWEKAFFSSSSDLDNNNNNNNKPSSEKFQDQINRKATIVIEHLIQASDVCHTMQHWHVYRRWNERLFHENSNAFKDGRAECDPADSWYKGEIGFFDFYIIPLAKKLSDCGVFGVSSDEYLNYAMRNRKEWEQRGNAIVDEMANRLKGRDAS